MQARINSIAMNYEVAGALDNPAVVLHHPLATNLSVWDELTAALASDYRVIRFDARGHGATEAPAGPYEFATLTRDVIALMDHLGVAKAAYIGVSMGGMIGQHLAIAHADRFYGFMLVSTSSRTAPEMRANWLDRVGAVAAKGMASQVEPAIGRWLAQASMRNTALVARLSDMIATTPAAGYCGWCEAISTLDTIGRLPGVVAPVTVVVGEEDQATPPAAAAIIHNAIPGSKLIVMPSASHQCMVEQPAAFAAIARAFLDRDVGA